MKDGIAEDELRIDKLERDGKVAVLISPGFGAGWSTWASEYEDFLMFDAGLVALAEKHATAPEVDEYLKQKLGPDAYVYTGGWGDIQIRWISKGEHFHIHEYDGSETLQYIDHIDKVA